MGGIHRKEGNKIMISIPTWFFVILCIFATFGAVLIILLLLAAIGGIASEHNEIRKFKEREKQKNENK